MAISKLVYDKFLLRKDEVVALQMQGNVSFHNEGIVSATILATNDNEDWQSFLGLSPNQTQSKQVNFKYLKLTSDTEVYCNVVAQNNAGATNTGSTGNTGTTLDIPTKGVNPLYDEIAEAIIAKIGNATTEQIKAVYEFTSELALNLNERVHLMNHVSDEGDFIYGINISNPPNTPETLDLTKVLTFTYDGNPLPKASVHTGSVSVITVPVSYKGTNITTLTVNETPSPLILR